jgi:hypothetical protein
LDAGDASAATSLLEDYLSTGACQNGNIGTPERVHEKANAGFDLGLTLFSIGEKFGRRFGEEEAVVDAGLTPEQEVQVADRNTQIDCALRIVRLIAGDSAVPIELRARANYLAGNLEFLRREYRSAVSAYDLSLKLVPGMPEDAGDGIGRDAAYNRAIALRRIQEDENRKDAGQDSGNDAGADAKSDAPEEPKDSGHDPSPEGGSPSKDSGPSDPQPDAGNPEPPKPDGGNDNPSGPDGGSPPSQPPPEQQSPSVNQDERILDMLEGAPTLQEHDAKNRALQRGPSGMIDK